MVHFLYWFDQCSRHEWSSLDSGLRRPLRGGPQSGCLVDYAFLTNPNKQHQACKHSRVRLNQIKQAWHKPALRVQADHTIELSLFSVREDVVHEESSHLRAQGIRWQVNQRLEGRFRADWAHTVQEQQVTEQLKGLWIEGRRLYWNLPSL